MLAERTPFTEGPPEFAGNRRHPSARAPYGGACVPPSQIRRLAIPRVSCADASVVGTRLLGYRAERVMAPEQFSASDRRPRLTPQIILGVMAIAVGVLLTLDNLGHLDAGYYIGFWPVGLIALGIAKLRQSRERTSGGLAGFILAGAGTWLVLEQASVVRFSVLDMWPALLVAAGGFLVRQGLTGPRVRASSDTNALVSAFALLSGVSRGNNSAAFRGGELTAVMGGCDLDLRQAAIDGDAVIEVFAMWGGIEIRVPDDWTVVMRVTPLLGGVADSTRPPQGASRHRLVVRGIALMGGVEVKN